MVSRDVNKQVPVFLHYCQFYRVERWGFHKRRVPGDIFSCEAPLYELPPEDLQKFDFKEDPYKKTKLSKLQSSRYAYALCNTLHRLNKALKRYKELFCDESNSNLKETEKIW